jgi:hypothetical protein
MRLHNALVWEILEHQLFTFRRFRGNYFNLRNTRDSWFGGNFSKRAVTKLAMLAKSHRVLQILNTNFLYYSQSLSGTRKLVGTSNASPTLKTAFQAGLHFLEEQISIFYSRRTVTINFSHQHEYFSDSFLLSFPSFFFF